MLLPLGSYIVAYLVETNVLGLLTEALTAKVDVVLADETGGVLAEAAKKTSMLAIQNFGVEYQRVQFAIDRLVSLVKCSSCSFAARHSLSRGKSRSMYSLRFGLFVPAARALAVVAWARVPDAFVRHDCGCGGRNLLTGGRKEISPKDVAKLMLWAVVRGLAMLTKLGFDT